MKLRWPLARVCLGVQEASVFAKPAPCSTPVALLIVSIGDSTFVTHQSPR
jgi:hypothetical protein